MRQPPRPSSSEPNVAGSACFCTSCGGDIVSGDRACRTCGAEIIDANVVTLLKRTSARRSSRGDDGRPQGSTATVKDDRFFPL